MDDLVSQMANQSESPSRPRDFDPSPILDYLNEAARKKDPLSPRLREESLSRKLSSIATRARCNIESRSKYWAEENDTLMALKDNKADISMEIDKYLRTSITLREEHFFHGFAVGLWSLWSQGLISGDYLIPLIQDINSQIITGSSKIRPMSESFGPRKTTKVKTTIDELMVFIDEGAIVKKSAERLNMDPKVLRKKLRRVIGDDYRDVLQEKHINHQKALEAYSIWKSQG